MNIINSGGWNVGNRAISEWMADLQGVSFVQGEMNATRRPGGLLDVLHETDLAQKKQRVAHLKTLCYRGYIRVMRKKPKALWRGTASLDHADQYWFYKDLSKRLDAYAKQVSDLSKAEEVAFWQDWLAFLSAQYGSQALSVYQNPFFYPEFYANHQYVWQDLFQPYKLIFIHRDPRDQIAEIMHKGQHLRTSSNVSGDIMYRGTETLPPLERTLAIISKIYQARINMAKQIAPEALAIFSFEDFVLNHEQISEQLVNFLDTPLKAPHARSYNSHCSKKNIGVYKNSPVFNQLVKDKEHLLEPLYAYKHELEKLKHSFKY